jgi:hypothetical protein
MSSAATVMSRILALAFFLVIGLAIFAFVQNSDLQAAQQVAANASRARDDMQLRVNALEKELAGVRQNLQACQAASAPEE